MILLFNLFISLECWNGEPDNRPTMSEVVDRLKSMMSTIKNNEADNLDDIAREQQQFNINLDKSQSSKPFSYEKGKQSKILQFFLLKLTSLILLVINYFKRI